MSIVLFAMMSMAQSEERRATKAESELEVTISATVRGKSPVVHASMEKVSQTKPLAIEAGTENSAPVLRGPEQQPSEEEVLV